MEFLHDELNKLLKQREQLLRNDSQEKKALIYEIKTLKGIKRFLTKLQDVPIENIDFLLKLPKSTTGFSEYRIIDDCDSDNKNDWIEIEKQVRLSSGDIIMKMK